MLLMGVKNPASADTHYTQYYLLHDTSNTEKRNTKELQLRVLLICCPSRQQLIPGSSHKQLRYHKIPARCSGESATILNAQHLLLSIGITATFPVFKTGDAVCLGSY